MSHLHASIQFRSISIDRAIEIAQMEQKPVFVDTYATWCGPCKVMDRVFASPDVANYFNREFVNVKIDMDGPHGEEMASRYQVVWLPTLLIINPDGEIISKVDRLVDGQELMQIADIALDGHQFIDATPLAVSPFAHQQPNSTQEQDYDPEDKERVIYVHDEKASSGRPHIMYHEAYLHLQLMDGKHMNVVRKYLSTQQDWTTEKNIKFIFDFVQDVRSPEFDYLMNHRPRFEEVLGRDRVSRSIDILVQQRLEKGFPRPTLSEAQRLFSIIDPNHGDQRAMKYHLSVLENEGRYRQYLQWAPTYLEQHNPYDHQVIHSYVRCRLDAVAAEESYDESVAMMYQALALDDTTAEYRFTMARLYALMGQRTPALDFADQAIALSTPQDSRHTAYLRLRDDISASIR
ncbi:MAG: thioredoxin family protein [Bacteroidota bacterium]